jgi:bifunctional pyridoxal-dependent enzyme with beta-cystathionase and maltose regulon repressor activities
MANEALHNLKLNIKISASDVVPSPSVCNLFASSILAFTKPQDYILIITPTYSFYKDSIL